VTPAQQRRVRDLFDAALDREGAAPADVDRWIAAEASDDPAVLREVQSLVAHHRRAGAFLVTPVLDRVPDLLAQAQLGPGDVVGPYTVARELGRGGMGRVYLATDTRLGRTVALKAVAPELAGSESQRERLRREARLAAGLSHPGICTVFALEEIDGELYIASEFVEGRTLRDAIASGGVPPSSEVVRIARELAAALAFAHARGVVHRDLKPENVMLTADGDHVRILDFGLARSEVHEGAAPAEFVTQPGLVLGTPAYMAPEQVHGGRGDARSDVYAFGVVVHEYATGAHPFTGAGPRARLDAHPAEIVARCLRATPAERFASAVELSAALEASTSAAPPGTTRHARWWRTHQAVIVALYAIAAVLAWQIKEWERVPVASALFFALGAASTIGAILRGHLLFTERVNVAALAAERKRAGRATRLIDLLVSGMLFADGMLITERPVPSVLTLGFALAVLLTMIVVEPATTRAAFGEE